MLRLLICGLICWCVVGCSEDEPTNDDCAPGLACNPDGEGADYCPWGECNWCSCDEDGEWSCTASSACDAEVEPDVGEVDASMPADASEPCTPGLACDSSFSGRCERDECNWCECDDGDDPGNFTWACTASVCADGGI